MANPDTLHKLKKYKAYLESHPNGDKVLLVLNKLLVLPVSISVLQETGLGKLVNGFRKHGGDVGNRARELVAKWKSRVADEASSSKKKAPPRLPPSPPPSPEPDSEPEPGSEPEQASGDESDRYSEDRRSQHSHQSDRGCSEEEEEYDEPPRRPKNAFIDSDRDSEEDEEEEMEEDDYEEPPRKKNMYVDSDGGSSDEREDEEEARSHGGHSDSEDSQGRGRKYRESPENSPYRNQNHRYRESASESPEHSPYRSQNHRHRDSHSPQHSPQGKRHRYEDNSDSSSDRGRRKYDEEDSERSAHRQKKYSHESPRNSSQPEKKHRHRDSPQASPFRVEKHRHREEYEARKEKYKNGSVGHTSSHRHDSPKHRDGHRSDRSSNDKPKLGDHNKPKLTDHQSSHLHHKTSHSDKKSTHGDHRSTQDVKIRSKHSEQSASKDHTSKHSHSSSSKNLDSNKSKHSDNRDSKHRDQSLPGDRKLKHIDQSNSRQRESKHDGKSKYGGSASEASTSKQSEHRSSSKDKRKEQSESANDKHRREKDSKLSSGSNVLQSKHVKDDKYSSIGLFSPEKTEKAGPKKKVKPASPRESMFDLFTVDKSEKVRAVASKQKSKPELPSLSKPTLPKPATHGLSPKPTSVPQRHEVPSSSGSSKVRSDSDKQERKDSKHKHDKSRHDPDRTKDGHSKSSSKHISGSSQSKHSSEASNSKSGEGSRSKSGEASRSKSGDHESRKKSEKRKHAVVEDDGMSFEEFMKCDTSGAPKRPKTMQPQVDRMNYDKFKIKKKTETKPARVESDDAGPSSKMPPPPKNVKITEQDILGYLPETHAHYRPWRFSEVEKKHGSEFDFAKVGLKSNTRTQVYSGRKHTTTEMKPLFSICMQVLIDNIDSLDYVGGIPADILMPVLKRCSPTQLYNLEDLNPHFLEDTDELWQKHCQREFRKSSPDEMETWRELYLRLLDEREAKYERLKGRMSKTVQKLDTTAKKVKLAYVDSVVKPPRDVKRMQQKYGTASVSNAPNKGNVDVGWSRSKLNQAVRPVAPPKPMKRVAPMMQKTMKMIKKFKR